MDPQKNKQKQVDLSEFEASMVYKVSSRTVRTVTQRNSVLKNKQTKKKRGICYIAFLSCLQ